MANPFLAEVRMFSFNFPPRGWALCAGQLLVISQNQALFSLLGTNFGGNGTTNFALPNFRGRTPIHYDGAFGGGVGQTYGAENHSLSAGEMPVHTHATVVNSAAADASTPVNNYWAAGTQVYSTGPSDGVMNALAIGNSGGSQPHSNMQPYLVVNFSIALQGIYPSRN